MLEGWASPSLGSFGNLGDSTEGGLGQSAPEAGEGTSAAQTLAIGPNGAPPESTRDACKAGPGAQLAHRELASVDVR